jgi:hypothetical protein
MFCKNTTENAMSSLLFYYQGIKEETYQLIKMKPYSLKEK